MQGAIQVLGFTFTFKHCVIFRLGQLAARQLHGVEVWIQGDPEKNAQSLMHRHFATVCSRIMGFHKNAQKLTGNTKNGQILNIVIKLSLFGRAGNT